MTKIVTVFLKRADMTRQQFRDYYEGHHVKMGLAANKYFGFHKYVRNHVVGAHGADPGFDCLTEFYFHDMSKAVGAQAFMKTPAGKAISEDELNFLDMTYHPSFEVQEHIVAGAPRMVDVGLTRKVIMALKRNPAVAADTFSTQLERFAKNYAREHAGGFSRLMLDTASEGPAGRPPFDALLTLWPDKDSAAAIEAFRWPATDAWSTVVDIESIEAAPETLGMS
jgi:uncharacterized protein (TIGR02118 family)